jgi:hypothetical protein
MADRGFEEISTSPDVSLVAEINAACKRVQARFAMPMDRIEIVIGSERHKFSY